MFRRDLLADTLDHESVEVGDHGSGLSLRERRDPLGVSMRQEVSCRIGNNYSVCRCGCGSVTGECVNDPRSGEEGVYVVVCGKPRSLESCKSLFGGIREVFIPDSVREIEDRCFFECKTLSRVIFGIGSSVERIGCDAFRKSMLQSICVPDRVRDLCDGCFGECKSLAFVVFGVSSSVERIGVKAFEKTAVRELFIPSSVREICGECFYMVHIERITFAAPSSLERIGPHAFDGANIKEISIPDSVRELCDACFLCDQLTHVCFGLLSSLVFIQGAFMCSKVGYILIPDSVQEISTCSFFGCSHLTCLSISPSSSLAKIGFKAFLETSLSSISIPDSVHSIDHLCFATRGP